MEYFIGQEIELLHNGENIKLRIEEDKEKNCKNCFFKSTDEGNCIRNNYSNMSYAFCTSILRNDKRYIIFRQIK